jgi:hypothetical protein
MRTIADHYWIIGGAADVYQSKSNTRVPTSNPDYAAWSVPYGPPTSIASEAELAEVLKTQGAPTPAWLLNMGAGFIQPTPTTYTKDQLTAYCADARQRKYAADITVNGLPFSTDPVSLGGLNAAMLYTSDKQVNAFSWKLPDGTFITLTALQVKDLQSVVAAFGQSCFVCEDDTLTKVEAGTVTTLAQIDALFAAVPNTFTSPITFGEVRHKRAKKAK